jgi:hypothetical protein
MKLIKPLLLVVAMLVLADFAFAQNWTLATTITNVAQYSSQGELLMSVASSADGNKLAAGVWNSFNVEVPILSPLYKSTDSGATWLPRFSYQDGFGSFGFNDWGAWNFIVSSADATKLTVISEEESLVYASTNSGIDWAQVSPPGYGLPGPIACSADGHILLAVDANQCLSVSTNSGTSWTPGTDSEIWTSVTVSADGNKMVATSAGRPDAIEVSTNCGVSWSPTLCPGWFWTSVACSADGQKLVATGNNPYGGIATSTNAGTTWTITIAPDTNWISVASSADGSVLVAAVTGGQLYTSTNSGDSWTESSLPPCTNWNQVVSSADGGNLVAISADGKIYTAQFIRQPALLVQASGSALTISWTVPSTDFVLQQSADLISWANVTNPPVLNCINLQNQVILPAASGSCFYRLKTP